ncbi:hypothetical protein HDU98_007499 [Podochytrium sp. JEL0797]|nr:hypothetical protein HDU98_007499 [Podochytrium sp. JEL0797]
MNKASPFADLRKQHLRNLTLDQLYERLDQLEDSEQREIDDVIAKFQREKEALMSSREAASRERGVMASSYGQG